MKQVRSDALVAIIICTPFMALMLCLSPVALGCSKADRARADLGNLRGALKTFYVKTGRVPTVDEGFAPLVKKQILENLSVDPWNEPYALWFAAGTSTSFIASSGKDRTWGTDDDIVAHDAAWPAPAKGDPTRTLRFW